jgi:transcriptional regulator with XRE-family HTH domain
MDTTKNINTTKNIDNIDNIDNIEIIIRTLVGRRKELKLTITEVAKRIGCMRYDLSRWEHRKKKKYDILMIEKYGRAVGMELIFAFIEKEIEKEV